MTQKNEERSTGTVEELRELFGKLISGEEAQLESDSPDPEDAPLEAQIPELVTDAVERDQPTLSGEEDPPSSHLVGIHFPLIYTFDEEESERRPSPATVSRTSVEPTEPSIQKRNPFVVLWSVFRSKLPTKGEATPVLVRKLAWLLAAAVFLCSVVFLVYDMAVQPAINESQYDRLAALWQPENQNTLQQEGYPQGMLEGFTSLYDKNADVRGWLTYRATGDEDFLSIDYPVMQADNNDTYSSKNFYGHYSKSGAPFFHKDNHLQEDNHSNKTLLVYGNNTTDGQMFAGLNKLVSHVNYARAAATMSLATLFEQHQYKVIAVMVTDEQAESNHYFDPCRLNFSTNGQFMDFVDQVRARSLFNFPVEVIPGDQLLTLTTEASRSVAKLTDARVTVIARKVRSGESAGVAVNDIVKNQDVIMPYAWYAGQDLEPHSYYETGELPE